MTVQKNRHTLGLAMIMKDEVQDLNRIIRDYGDLFDALYVTVTDKKTYTLLKKQSSGNSEFNKVELSYFEWINHFGKARAYNRHQVKTDYWMWIDMDDEIEGAEKIPQIFRHMVEEYIDLAWLKYEYVSQDISSKQKSSYWRERIIKTGPNLIWNDIPVHETLDESVKGDVKDELHMGVLIKHRKTIEQFIDSQNKYRIILEDDWKHSPTAETGYYLGSTLSEIGENELAVEKLEFALSHTDKVLLKFLIWLSLCKCYIKINKIDAALTAAEQSIALKPDHPEPWYLRYNIYWKMDLRGKAMECAEIAMSKRIEGKLETEIEEPSWFNYRGPFNIAYTYLSMGNVGRARQLYEKVARIAPDFINQQSSQIKSEFAEAFERHLLETKVDTSELTIPKIMHVIWIGDESKRPNEWISTWRDKHPSWEYKIWGNEELESHNWHNKELINFYISKGRYNGVADCMRYQILYEEGGFMHEADSICLESIDELFTGSAYDSYAVYENEMVRPGLISPLYGAVKGSEFAKILMDSLPDIPPTDENGTWLEPWLITGNAYMKRMRELIVYPKLKVFPSHYFTPIHYTGIGYLGSDKVYSVQQWGSTDNNEYPWPLSKDQLRAIYR